MPLNLIVEDTTGPTYILCEGEKSRKKQRKINPGNPKRKSGMPPRRGIDRQQKKTKKKRHYYLSSQHHNNISTENDQEPKERARIPKQKKKN